MSTRAWYNGGIFNGVFGGRELYLDLVVLLVIDFDLEAVLDFKRPLIPF